MKNVKDLNLENAFANGKVVSEEIANFLLENFSSDDLLWSLPTYTKKLAESIEKEDEKATILIETVKLHIRAIQESLRPLLLTLFSLMKRER